MAICVEIMLSDEGVVSVKECEPREEMGEESGQEVQTLDEAFRIAEDILLGEGDGGMEEKQFSNEFKPGMGDMLNGGDPVKGAM